MLAATNKAPDGDLWAIDDPVVRLRIWGDERAYMLPPPPIAEWIVGAAPEADLRLQDEQGSVSRRHARLARDRATWTLHDLDSTNGLREDGERRRVIQLAPGVEIELGAV